MLGFPAGYAGLVCLRVGRGFSLRAGSVRGYEALFAVARPRGAMAACVGCFLLFGGLPSASRRALFSVRARARQHIYTSEAYRRGRWACTMQCRSKQTTLMAVGSLSLALSSKATSLCFESGIPSPELSRAQNSHPTSSGGDMGPKNPIKCTSRAPRRPL